MTFFKYNEHHDEAGRFSSGGGRASGKKETRGERAKTSHKPATKEKQQLGEAEQARLAVAIGGEDQGDNEAMDVVVGEHGVEVKTIIDNDNDKVTVHPESRARKEAWARKTGKTLHTVVIDVRAGRRAYYHREGVGSYRLGAMTKVTLAELREMMR